MIQGMFPYGFIPVPPDPQVTPVKQAPCPACGCESYVCRKGDFHCTGCDRVRAEAEIFVKRFAQRDANGSLLCQKCNNPYPYAEPDKAGRFVCTSCKTSLD